MLNPIKGLLMTAYLAVSIQAHAQDMSEPMDQQDIREKATEACMADAVLEAADERRVDEIRQECEARGSGILDYRLILEKRIGDNPFAILPHRQNYILPASYSDLDETVYEERLEGRSLDNTEIEFQVSIRFIATEDIIVEDLDLEIGFTAVSFWQAYNSDISAPFRETNYEPELMLRYKRGWSLLGLPVRFSYLSLNHQSNGQSGSLSRSWNRIIAGLAFQHGDLVWSAALWARIPEDDKEFENDPGGDDNPDIEKFVGQGQIGLLWKSSNEQNFLIQIRNNLRRENRGSIKLGWSFPFSTRLRGYIQYFNGYGESLISYDQHSSRLGVGILLTDWL